MTYLESINKALKDIFIEDNKAILIGEDITDPYGGAFKVTKGLHKNFSERVISSPISESAIVGFATGCSIKGLKPIVEIMFGDFITLITDQIVNHLTKFTDISDKISPKILIRTPMGGFRGYGATHSQSLEWLFFNIDNFNIYYPSIFHDPSKILKKAFFENNYSSLFIEGKILYPQELLSNKNFSDFYKIENMKFEIKKIIIDPSYSDNEEPTFAFFTFGNLSKIVADVQKKIYMSEEIISDLFVFCDLKNNQFDDINLNYKKIFIVEESYNKLSWSSFVIDALYRKYNFKGEVVKIAAKGSTIPSSINLEKEYLPTLESIYQEVIINYE